MDESRTRDTNMKTKCLWKQDEGDWKTECGSIYRCNLRGRWRYCPGCGKMVSSSARRDMNDKEMFVSVLYARDSITESQRKEIMVWLDSLDNGTLKTRSED